MGMKKELSIKETQQISLEILHEVSSICEELNLRYFLMYGTLIGAIRHQGYIPWDDDVDIMMPRKDYKQLLNYFYENRDKYPHLEIFNHDVNPKYPYMITRISDNRYIIEMVNEDQYGMGVFIDIYPFDGLGNTLEEAKRYAKKGDLLSSICYQSTRKHFKMETTTNSLKKVLKFPFYCFSKLVGKEYTQKKLKKFEEEKDYDSSKYVGCIVWLSGGQKDIFERRWLDDFIMKPYEQYEFRVPKEYDKVLSHIYGDYMCLPPVNERVGHHEYKVYLK